MPVIAWVIAGYFALGIVTLWCAKQEVTTDHWYNWIIVLLVWPYFILILATEERP